MFVIINNAGIKTNADVNVKNWLTREDVMKNLFGILVNVNVIKSCDVGQYFDYESCKCRKKLIDKLVEKCSENIDGYWFIMKLLMIIE